MDEKFANISSWRRMEGEAGSEEIVRRVDRAKSHAQHGSINRRISRILVETEQILVPLLPSFHPPIPPSPSGCRGHFHNRCLINEREEKPLLCRLSQASHRRDLNGTWPQDHSCSGHHLLSLTAPPPTTPYPAVFRHCPPSLEGIFAVVTCSVHQTPDRGQCSRFLPVKRTTIMAYGGPSRRTPLERGSMA